MGSRSTWLRLTAALAVWAVLASRARSPVLQECRTSCAAFLKALDLTDRVGTFDLLSEVSSQQRDASVIVYGTQAHVEFRYKPFHVLKEPASVFFPDSPLTHHVLAHYEQGFLSPLLAFSYLHRGQPDEAKVGLRRLAHTLFAPLDNVGENPVPILLWAILWEPPDEPGRSPGGWVLPERPGQRTRERPRDSARLCQRSNAPHRRRQRSETDLAATLAGTIPRKTGLCLSMQSWFDKIAVRHSHAHHPLPDVPSSVRSPMGTIYSLVRVAAGAGSAVVGCVADVSSKGNGMSCDLSVRGGLVLMGTAPRVLRGALKPDLHHWSRIPAAFVVTTAADPANEGCSYNCGRALAASVASRGARLTVT